MNVSNNFQLMLEDLRIQTQREVRSLRIIMELRGKYASCEERDTIIDQLKYDISEIVLTILLKEDKDKQTLFLTHK